MTRPSRQTAAPRRRNVACALMCLLAPFTRAEPLPFGHWMSSSLDHATGLAGELLLMPKEDGFVLHDAHTFEPHLIVRDGHSAVTFTPDGAKMLMKKQGYQLLDLESGDTTPVAPPCTFDQVFVNADSTQLVALTVDPDRLKTTRIRIQRYDLTSGNPVEELGVLTPLRMPFFELQRVLPSRLPDHAILVFLDREDTGDLYDPHRWGDYQFVHLNLNTGKNARLSTLADPSHELSLDDNLNWTSAARDLLHTANYPDYAYTLINPYAGKVVRKLKVPGVKFDTSDPTQVIALRETSNGGTEQLFRDYLEPGTLKTIRNVPIASVTDYPERAHIILPEAYKLLTAAGPDAIAFHQDDWHAPYALVRIDTTTGEVAHQFDGTANALFHYSDITFHPTKPEFFASTLQGEVHFFRFTDSGLKRQNRGSGATSIHYTPDGSALVSTEEYEGPFSTTPVETFPFQPTFTFDYPRLQNTLSEYDDDFVVSPSKKWFISQTQTLSTLYRFGDPAIVAELPYSDRDSSDSYVFSPDERFLARFAREEFYDEATDTPASYGDLSVLKMDILLSDSWDNKAWSDSLDHGQYQLVGWNARQELILVDPRTAELVFIQSAEIEPRRVPIDTLKPEDFANGAPVTYYDDATGRVYLGLNSGIAVVDSASAHPSASRIAVDGSTESFHRLGDQRHVVAELRNGSLVFLDLTAATATATATLEFYNEGQDYLLRTPTGRFDATPATQRDGVMLSGYRPIRLTQIFNQAYDPELFTRLFEGLPADTKPLADFAHPPTVTIESNWVSSLRYRLFLRAESKLQDLADLRLYQNDKLIRTFPPSWLRGASIEVDVDLLLEPENHFRLIATTESGVESLPAELVLSPPEAELRRASQAQRPAELHLLVVGVNEYRNPEYNLNFAVPDASAVLAQLQAVNRPLFATINTHYLTDAQATHDRILAEFAAIKDAAQPHDAFLFYFAGHGVMSKTDGKFYLIPHDVTRIYGASQSLTANGLSADALRALSAEITAQKQLFILDACNSGGALQTFTQRGASQEKALAQLARATGTHWIAASSANQFATEFAELGHGAFTHTLLQALAGGADTGDKRVTINELKAYLESELPTITQRYKGAPQYPSSYGYGQDFPIALLP